MTLEVKLPKQVRDQLRVADDMIERRAWSRRGPKPRSKAAAKKTAAAAPVFVADTFEEIDKLLRAWHLAVGPRSRGNKRHGKGAFYGELVACFVGLRAGGITLPRGGSLSSRACTPELIAILLKHRCLAEDEIERLHRGSALRRRIGRTLKREFTRVADAVNEVYPT